MATESLITETNSAAVPAAPSLDQLSFTSRRADDGVELWSPAEVAGDWAAQCHAGRDFGSEAVDYIRATGDATMLSGIVRAIAECGKFSGVEAGFFTAVSTAIEIA